VNEKKDLGIALLGATVLLFGMGYLTQCTSARPNVTDSLSATPLSKAAAQHDEGGEREIREGGKKSVRELADEEEAEERSKVQNIGRALQTVAANPQLRATYGFPP